MLNSPYRQSTLGTWASDELLELHKRKNIFLYLTVARLIMFILLFFYFRFSEKVKEHSYLNKGLVGVYNFETAKPQ